MRGLPPLRWAVLTTTVAPADFPPAQDRRGYSGVLTAAHGRRNIFCSPPPALDGHPLRANLHRTDPAKRLLTSRGFHWINEYPFNR